MPPPLIEQGCIQILGQTANSVVYAVDTDASPGRANDTPTVLKGCALWYRGCEPLGPWKPPEEADQTVRDEAAIYDTLGKHERILDYVCLEVAVLKGADPKPKAWAIRLGRAPGSNLRQYLYKNPTNPPGEQVRLKLALQFAEGLAYIHSRGVVWSDVSTRNALMFDGWRLKLCDFGTSSRYKDHDHKWWGAECRYTPPGPEARHPMRKDILVGTIHREVFALGSAIYEIVEWKVPYGSEHDVSSEEVYEMLIAGKWPELSSSNAAKGIIRRCWAYKYETAQQVVLDLKSLLGASLQTSNGIKQV